MGLNSIFGGFSQAAAMKGQASVTRANARVARAQGQAAKGQAYGQAARIETANKAAGEQAVENMQRVHRNATLARGAARTQRGASGFTSQGSGQQAEVSVLERYEQTAQDMAQARSLQDMEARFSASMSRKSGDLAELGGEANYEYGMAQAKVQDQLAKNARMSGIAGIAGAVAGGAIGGLTGAGVLYGANIGGGAVALASRGIPGTWNSVTGGAFSSAEKDFSAFVSKKLSSWMS